MKMCNSGPARVIAMLLVTAVSPGCGKREAEVTETGKAPLVSNDPNAVTDSGAAADPAASPAADAPLSFEATAEQLLTARLPPAEASAGWIRLFDGATLFGWEVAGEANWRVEDGKLVVDRGEPCLLCTSVPWQNYELTLQYKADADTNSGVFLRTPLDPQDPATDCYEVNIAPPDNPFPTGSVVQRQKADPVASSDDWQTMHLKFDGNQLQVTVNDQLVCDLTDPDALPAGRIGLQHNQGRIEFRDVRLRPLGLQSQLDAELSQWKKYPQMPGEFTVTEDGWLHVKGGKTQLESKESFGDFVLLAEYKLPTAEMNSGIFFRCIPGDEMMGYECQLSNEMVDGNPLAPADCGTGGIFRRQDARVIAGEVDQWASLVLVAAGNSMAAWVNGVQVSNWTDDRPPHENPRKGSRVAPGTLMIQGHDPSTDAMLKQIAVVALP